MPPYVFDAALASDLPPGRFMEVQYEDIVADMKVRPDD